MKHVAGIDVSHKTLDLVVRKKGKSHLPRSYTNTAEGHRSLIKYLRQQAVTHVCVEATGSYHIDIAIALSQAKELEVMVINPRASKHFAQALMRRSKTDRIDADVLAQYTDRMVFTPWSAPDEDIVVLRACSRRLAALTQHKAKTKNQLHALKVTAQTPTFILEDVQLSITHLEQQIDNLHRRAIELTRNNKKMAHAFDLLVSIKGIGEVSAIQILGELLILSPDMSAKQWVAYAGLDPRHHQSGTSVNKKAHLTKAGNRHLRAALYMPALCAAHHNHHVSAYYQHMINDNGLTKLQAICAVMRKLLHAINGMLKSEKPFEGRLFYAIPEQQIIQ